MTHGVSIAALAQKVVTLSRHGDLTRLATGITHDSREVKEGDLFVCLKGAKFDGHRYAQEALRQGAVGLVVQQSGLSEVSAFIAQEIPTLTVSDSRRALPALACALYADPSQTMTMVGVTGTNGKTTTTLMVAAILRQAGLRVGIIGTLGAELDGVPIPSDHTTPEADQLQCLLALLRDKGAQAVVMEVSSHALSQYRPDGIAFNVGIFTNLTQDHLDFHETMQEYFEAKSRLFMEFPILYPRKDGKMFVGVINVGSREGREMVTFARGDALTYAIGAMPAVLKAEEARFSPNRVEFTAIYDSGIEKMSFPIALPIGGAFQAENALGAIGAALRLGVSPGVIQRGLGEMPPVPGRFEAVPTAGHGFQVIVDYAHTPDGLENLLRSAQELKPKRILVVFGCGGDRDRTKRPLMGGLCAKMADVAIVTSDNPRTEDPNAIIAEILAGMDKDANPDFKAEIQVEPDRRKAIFMAIQRAQEGDLVLLAGKGHEDYQIIGTEKRHFDDREVAREALATGGTA